MVDVPMTDSDYVRLGKACREAKSGNMLIGSFAADMIGESYPFSQDMWQTLFKNYDDLTLGKRFVAWMHQPETKDVRN